MPACYIFWLSVRTSLTDPHMQDVPLMTNFSRRHIIMDIASVFFHFFYIDKFLTADITGTLFGSAILAITESARKCHKINFKLLHILYCIWSYVFIDLFTLLLYDQYIMTLDDQKRLKPSKNFNTRFFCN